MTKGECSMKLRTFITTLIIALLILIITLLFILNNKLNALDEVNQKLAGIHSQYANIHEQFDSQSKLLEEIVANQHRPIQQPQKAQPKVEDQVPSFDTYSVTQTVPFLPLIVGKLKSAFGF
jgi:cell division protein FtsB